MESHPRAPDVFVWHVLHQSATLSFWTSYLSLSLFCDREANSICSAIHTNFIQLQQIAQTVSIEMASMPLHGGLPKDGQRVGGDRE